MSQSSSNSEFTPQSAASSWDLPSLFLAILITVYAIYFSAYTINRHNTLHSYAADLSLIDQPMWNTILGHGGFMELTWGDHQQPRLAEHFEPILAPLSLLFLLWDNVCILLIAQSVVLALGAIPVFWIARERLKVHKPSTLSSWAALAFAFVYLLFPPLQAANVADFHADSFAVTPLLFAFWYAAQRRWGWMWFWAIVVMSTKETLPTLTVMLGLWLILKNATEVAPPGLKPVARLRGRNIASPKGIISLFGDARHSPPEAISIASFHGLALILVSALWFFVATFLIVAPLAQQYFDAAGPIYFTNRYVFDNGLTGWRPLLQDPVRQQYLFGLLAAIGFLPLLAPELLLLGLPVLIANLLSNFSGQYSGEQHYSAPLAVPFILAAIYGTRRLFNKASLREENKQTGQTTMLINTILWLLGCALSYHTLYGWTPLSVRTETYTPTPASVRLADFIAPILPEAVVSASAAIHPHLAHRRVVYIFPTVQEADYLLVDVADIPGVHPNDAQTKILDLLNSGWRLLRAEQGLILAQKSPSTPPPPLAPCALVAGSPLPCSFFDFARATTSPAFTADLSFGDGRLKLLGYEAQDDPDNGVTFRFYWQVSDTLPQNLRLWPLIYDDWGQLLNDPAQTPLVAAIWYPPASWRPGETIVTATLPQHLPNVFHLGITIGPEDSLADPNRRFSVTGNSNETIRFQSGRWAQLATFQRQGPFLATLPARPSLEPLAPVEANFGPGIRLTGFRLGEKNLHPGETLPILLRWTANQTIATDFTVFIHLLAPDGRRVAQSDAYPTWLTPQPTSQWSLHQPVLDSHRLQLPADLPAGVYTLQLGLYNIQTQKRLFLPDGSDTFTLVPVKK